MLASRVCLHLAFAVLLWASTYGDGTAQVPVRGIILDDKTSVPVADARILFFVLGDEEPHLLVAESDSAGMFRVTLPHAGSYRISVSSFGYETLAADRIHVPAPAPEFELRLIPDAVAIDPLTVTAEAQSVRLTGVGFYTRRAGGTGYFVAEDEILQRTPAKLTDVLRTIPAVRTLSDFGGDGATGAEIYFRNALRGLDSDGGRPCLPTLVFDGAIVRHGGPLPDPRKQRIGAARSGRPIRLDELVHPQNVAGIELYPSGAGVPPQWAGSDAYCGVVLIWTKR